MCFAVALLLPAAWWCSEFTPTVYSVESSAECGEYNHLKDEELKTKLVEAIARLPSQQTYNSCLTSHNAVPSTPSGYYNIITNSNSTVQVYCDMEGTNCGGDGGWTRVAYVNMKQPGATCPQGLEEKTSQTFIFVVFLLIKAVMEHSFLHKYATPRYVDGFEVTNTLCRLAFCHLTMTTASPLTMYMSMVSPSHMAILHANTFGRMSVDQESRHLTLAHPRVHVNKVPQLQFLHMLVLTTTARLVLRIAILSH